MHKPLLHIFNQSLQSRIFPDQQKIARVNPLFKKGSNSELGNYPPGMRRRSDVSFWSHLDWDVADRIETSSRRRYWYFNVTDLFGTLSRRLTSASIEPTNLRRHSHVPTVT